MQISFVTPASSPVAHHHHFSSSILTPPPLPPPYFPSQLHCSIPIVIKWLLSPSSLAIGLPCPILPRENARVSLAPPVSPASANAPEANLAPSAPNSVLNATTTSSPGRKRMSNRLLIPPLFNPLQQIRVICPWPPMSEMAVPSARTIPCISARWKQIPGLPL